MASECWCCGNEPGPTITQCDCVLWTDNGHRCVNCVAKPRKAAEKREES